MNVIIDRANCVSCSTCWDACPLFSSGTSAFARSPASSVRDGYADASPS